MKRRMYSIYSVMNEWLTNKDINWNCDKPKTVLLVWAKDWFPIVSIYRRMADDSVLQADPGHD